MRYRVMCDVDGEFGFNSRLVEIRQSAGEDDVVWLVVSACHT